VGPSSQTYCAQQAHPADRCARFAGPLGSPSFGGNLAIDASLELQTPYSTKNTKNIPAVFPLFKPALLNRVM
jgi:hypothetical protein